MISAMGQESLVKKAFVHGSKTLLLSHIKSAFCSTILISFKNKQQILIIKD